MLFLNKGLIYDVFGVLLYFIGFVHDYTDGSLARITKKTSNWGFFLDANADTVTQFFMYLLITLRAYNVFGVLAFLFFAFLMLYWVISMVSGTMRVILFDKEEKRNLEAVVFSNKKNTGFYFLMFLKNVSMALFICFPFLYILFSFYPIIFIYWMVVYLFLSFGEYVISVLIFYRIDKRYKVINEDKLKKDGKKRIL